MCSLDSYYVAHSPDADDIFMYYPIYFGWIGNNFRFKNIPLDIEKLNKEALKLTYDISAISFALYPKIRNSYALLKTGISFGNGYGPKMIKLKNKILKKNFKVALSGENTTNAMIFKLKYKDAKIIYKNFLEIEQAVLSGEVDCGILIHESILNFSNELEICGNIWDFWLDFVKDELPLPLGGMVIRRSIPLTKAIKLESAFINAVELAIKYQDLLSNMILNKVRINKDDLKIYLSMYANKNSICLNELQIKSLNALYKLGFDNKIYRETINIEDYLIPVEYEHIRHS